MNLEELLRSAVEEQTSRKVPPAPTAELVRRGRLRRTRRTVAGAAASVLVLGGGVVTATQLGDGDGTDRGGTVVSSQPTSSPGPEPVAGPTQVYVSADGRLHLPELTVPSDMLPCCLQLTSTGAVYLDSQFTVHFVTIGGRDIELGVASGSVYADPYSPLVVWREGSDDGSAVLYDTEQRREVARRSLACPASGTCPEVNGLSNGLVFVHTADGQFGWDPLGIASLPSPYVRIGPDPIAAARGRTVLSPSRLASYPGLPNGWRIAAAPPERAQQLSYDGGWVLDSDAAITSLLEPSMPLEMAVPGTVWSAAWDLDGSVLVVTSAGDGYQVLDCTVDAGCEPVSPVESAPQRLPDVVSLDVPGG